jgi:hypothetical protein
VHDPQATINVANDRPEVVERLRALANFPTTPTAPTRLEPDAAQRRALESLGYVEE